MTVVVEKSISNKVGRNELVGNKEGTREIDTKKQEKAISLPHEKCILW